MNNNKILSISRTEKAELKLLLESLEKLLSNLISNYGDIRSLNEISEERQFLCDKVWYNFHLSAISNETYLGNTPQEILAGAFSNADRIVDTYGEENLIVNDEFEGGELIGKYMALSWVLGMEWDEIPIG